jgi:metal-sulfur cluster biosynthetic enzyme
MNESNIYLNLRQLVVNVLKQIYDPELPINIYDLGLIYGVDLELDTQNPDQNKYVCTIIMTFTSPNCPSCEDIVAEIQTKIVKLDFIGKCNVDIVWEPAWNKNNLPEEILLELDMW